MTAPRKPRWKRKRWITAVMLWLSLPVLYPLSLGPAFYAWYSDWISDEMIVVYAIPIAEVQKRSPACDAVVNDYVNWWYGLYVKHNPEDFRYSEPEQPILVDDPDFTPY